MSSNTDETDRRQQGYDLLMAKARGTNDDRDRIGQQHDFANPSQCPLDVHLRTAMSAIECGMKLTDWDAVAEGQAMLEEVLRRLPWSFVEKDAKA